MTQEDKDKPQEGCFMHFLIVILMVNSIILVYFEYRFQAIERAQVLNTKVTP